MTTIILILAALLAGGIVGFLAGRLPVRKSFKRKASELEKVKEELANEREITTQIPVVVRRLGESRLSPGAIPGIAVRITKEIFRTPAAGFFAPEKGKTDYLLVEGVGFPPEWKGTSHFSCSEGILGAALKQHIVLSKENYLAGKSDWPRPAGTLEGGGVLPDLVAPVAWGGEAHGVLVVAGSNVPLGGKRPYAAMIADIMATAFRNSFFAEEADPQVVKDQLTGAYNLTYFAHRFESEIRRSKNYMTPLSILIFNIDNFRKVNEAFGHHAGDIVLKEVAARIRKVTRSSDFTVRYGGEEFVVVMTSSSEDQAFLYAERLRQMIGTTEFLIRESGTPLKITISGGVATFPHVGQSTTELIKAAEQALLAAKRGGRNRIVCAYRVGLERKP